MSTHGPEPSRLLHVGEFAKTIGKTVRALHLYEELDLLKPIKRTKGGFRLYDQAAVERARWIIKLQNIGFTLAQIQGFVAAFETAETGRDASAHARQTFQDKLADVRSQIADLRTCETDLEEAIAYLDACGSCTTDHAPCECRECSHPGHEAKPIPQLYAGLSESRVDTEFDVPISAVKQRPRVVSELQLTKEPLDGVG